jgi:peroxiredoxin
VQLVAIVAQSPAPVRRYIEETGLNFNILIDERRDVLRAYGVWHRIGLDAWNVARPALFLVDQASRIRYAYVASRQDEFPEPADVDAAIDSLETA